MTVQAWVKQAPSEAGRVPAEGGDPGMRRDSSWKPPVSADAALHAAVHTLIAAPELGTST